MLVHFDMPLDSSRIRGIGWTTGGEEKETVITKVEMRGSMYGWRVRWLMQ